MLDLCKHGKAMHAINEKHSEYLLMYISGRYCCNLFDKSKQNQQIFNPFDVSIGVEYFF